MKIYYVVNKYTNKILGSVVAATPTLALVLAKARHGSYATIEELK